MLVLEGIYPARPPHFPWGGAKCQRESLCPRSEGMMACPCSMLSPLCLLPPPADAPIPSLPAHYSYLTRCRAHVRDLTRLGATEGETHVTGSHRKYHGIYSSAPLWKSIPFWNPYIKLIFHPEERPQIFQTRERNFQGYTTQVSKQKEGPIKLPST